MMMNGDDSIQLDYLHNNQTSHEPVIPYGPSGSSTRMAQQRRISKRYGKDAKNER